MDIPDLAPTIVALSGVVLFLTGAGIATSVGVWGATQDETLQNVADAPDAWRVGNVALGAGALLTGVGIAALAPMQSWGRLGGGLWLAAGTLGALGFLLQGIGKHALAVRTTADGAAVYDVIQGVGEALIGGFELLAYLACAALAYAALEGGASRWAGRAVLGASLVLAALLVARIEAFPAVAEFVAVATVFLLRSRHSAELATDA